MSASAFRNTLYGRLLGHVFPHWRILAVSFASTAVLAATEPAMPALLKILLDGSFVERDNTLVRLMPLAIVALFLVRGLAGFVSNYSTGWIGSRLVTDLREIMFRRLMRVPMAFFDEHASGVVLSRFTYDVNQVTKAATNAWVTVVRDSLAVIGLLGWMFWLSWELTLFTLVIVPPIGLAIRIASRRLRRLNRASQQQMGGLNHVIREVLGAQREIRVFGADDYEIRRFNARANKVRQMYNKTIATTAASVPIVQLFIAVALAALVYFAMLQTGDEAFTVGAFVSYFGAMAMLFAPMKRLTKVNDDIQRGLAAAESVFFIADQQVEADPPQAERLGRVRGDIRFEHVSFRYPGQSGDALDDVDLHIPAGTTVALVGASGSGKTTLANLIPLFLRPPAGRVLLDGRDITSLPLRDLRGQIALVSQQVVLFDDTVAANIAYGRQEEVGRAELEQAASMAHASEFIDHLSAGMDTGVGENGAQLSGGQRQRIAIARALVKDAPILIMDEATSALDTHSERRIQAAIETVSRGRTSVVIAHRLSTIENADLIVVLDRGRVVETGTHGELLARDGHYAALHRAQTSGDREQVA
ncbi:MAG: lipid A export permease/ATP-binding protein MsbA [Chromatiales bacterium]|jgi:subfamily B ATP-binding cassette protein MsbA